MEEHEKTLSTISSRISSFYERKVPFRLYHGSTNSTQTRKVDRNRMVDTSTLNHVLKVDKQSKTCLVEPNVPMDQLVDATLPYGLLPKVVMGEDDRRNPSYVLGCADLVSKSFRALRLEGVSAVRQT